MVGFLLSILYIIFYHIDANAISACSVGAIDALIQLSKDNVRRSKKFATDALEKLINYRKKFV
jgi:hypothetical protein